MTMNDGDVVARLEQIGRRDEAAYDDALAAQDRLSREGLEAAERVGRSGQDDLDRAYDGLAREMREQEYLQTGQRRATLAERESRWVDEDDELGGMSSGPSGPEAAAAVASPAPGVARSGRGDEADAAARWVLDDDDETGWSR